MASRNQYSQPWVIVAHFWPLASTGSLLLNLSRSILPHLLPSAFWQLDTAWCQARRRLCADFLAWQNMITQIIPWENFPGILTWFLWHWTLWERTTWDFVKTDFGAFDLALGGVVRQLERIPASLWRERSLSYAPYCDQARWAIFSDWDWWWTFGGEERIVTLGDVTKFAQISPPEVITTFFRTVIFWAD